MKRFLSELEELKKFEFMLENPVGGGGNSGVRQVFWLVSYLCHPEQGEGSKTHSQPPLQKEGVKSHIPSPLVGEGRISMRVFTSIRNSGEGATHVAQPINIGDNFVNSGEGCYARSPVGKYLWKLKRY